VHAEDFAALVLAADHHVHGELVRDRMDCMDRAIALAVFLAQFEGLGVYALV